LGVQDGWRPLQRPRFLLPDGLRFHLKQPRNEDRIYRSTNVRRCPIRYAFWTPVEHAKYRRKQCATEKGLEPKRDPHCLETRGERASVLELGFQDNREWLQIGKRATPIWIIKLQCWEIPKSWFNEFIARALKKHRRLYIIQPYREQEKCSPACLNAVDHECQCSCMHSTSSQPSPPLTHCPIVWRRLLWPAVALTLRLLRKAPHEEDSFPARRIIVPGQSQSCR